ncbi:MAG: hypothetical protein EPO07_01710 [Verrucomicrobia bacterium]|nr:MAG: hypothetical protein EPO07_01710 [Verrucomicrobiota bacterium]
MTTLTLTIALTCLTLRTTAAEDKSTADPTGTWKVTISSTNPQNHPSENKLTLKLASGTLAGTLSRVSAVNGAAATWPIKEAKLQKNEISFKVVNGGVTLSYEGKINGATIKGTLKTESSGKTSSTDWKAERFKE